MSDEPACEPPDPAAHLAPATTRLGQLQRGRGAGHLAAMAAGAAAHDDVLRCIVDDPRCDRQLEDRARGYAELVVALDVPLAPIVAGLAGAAELQLGHEVLAGAFRLAHAPVRALLASHATADAVVAGVTEALWGRRWATRVELPPRAAAAWLALALDDAQCARAVRRRPARDADLAALDVAGLLDLGRDIRGERDRALFAELCRRDAEADRCALAAVVRDDVVFGRVRLAARVLGALGDERLLPLAVALFAREDVIEDPSRRLSGFERMRRVCLSHYVEALPAPRALALAREWHGRGGYFATVAGSVFAEHATAADRRRLEAFVAEHRRQGGGFEVILELDALGRLGDPASAPLLVEVAREAAYGHARRRAVHALAAMPDAPGAADVLREALWDCEDEAAADGVAFVPDLDAAARCRVAALAESPLADAELQARARRRLARPGADAPGARDGSAAR